MTPPRLGPAPDPSTGQGSSLCQSRCSVEKARAHLPGAGAGRSDGGSSCRLAAAVSGAPRGCAGGRPRGAGSGRRALRPDTAHPASRLLATASSPHDATGGEGRGLPSARTPPGPAAALALEEAPADPAPALSTRLTPPAGRSRCRAASSVSMRPLRTGMAGTRRWAPGHGGSGRHSGAWARDGRRQGRHTEPLVTCGPGQESLRTQVNPQPQQHKMADTSPRTSRDPARRTAPRPAYFPHLAPSLHSSFPRQLSLPRRTAPPVGHAPPRDPDAGLGKGGAAAAQAHSGASD